jgi:pyruvate formate lyase activating enzyme
MNTDKGYVFDIQRYSIHDGPGIRTTVFLKGCPLTCPWCSNPESQSQHPEITHFESRCTGCGECVAACTQLAISKIRFQSEDESEKIRPNIDRTLCNVCGECVRACRNNALQICGMHLSVEEILSEVVKDRPFYKRSGGGMTLSGGEPSFQIDFSKKLLTAARDEGIHTAIETSGIQKPEVFEYLCDGADTILYDIKIIDREEHRRILGITNDIILYNLKNLIQRGRTVFVRIPIIPGYTDSKRNIRAIARFLLTLSGRKETRRSSVGGEGHIQRVDLIAYHRLGASKYRSLGQIYTLSEKIPPDQKQMESLMDIVSEFGFSVQIGG